MTNSDSLRIGFITLKRWLENRNSGKTFDDYLTSFGYKNAAIYGAGEVGQLLYAELKGKFKVLYFIDRNAEMYCQIDGIPVVLPQELSKLEQSDIIVITVMSDFNEISASILSGQPNQPIVALRDAVYEF